MQTLLTEILIPLFSPIINFYIHKRQFKSFKTKESYKYFDRIIEIINYHQWDFRINKENWTCILDKDVFNDIKNNYLLIEKTNLTN